MFKNKVLKIITMTIAVAVSAILVCYALISAFFGTFDFTKWKASLAATPSTTTGGMTVSTDDKENRIGLAVAEITPATYSDYGISAQAESAYTITATVKDENGQALDAYQSVTYSMAWASTNSANVSTYVSLTTSGTTATLTCLKAFSTQIIVTCTSTIDTSIKATATLGYAAAISTTGFELYGDDGDSVVTCLKYATTSGSYSIGYGDGWIFNDLTVYPYNATYGTGTVNDSYSNVSLSISVNPSYLSAIQTALGVTPGTYTVNLSTARFEMSSVCQGIFGSTLFSTSENKAKVYNALQSYYTNNQAVFRVTLSMTFDHRGTLSYNYDLLCDFSALSTSIPVLSNIYLSSISKIF